MSPIQIDVAPPGGESSRPSAQVDGFAGATGGVGVVGAVAEPVSTGGGAGVGSGGRDA
jgi:hypothetical protein